MAPSLTVGLETVWMRTGALSPEPTCPSATPAWIRYGDFSAESGFWAVGSLLSETPRPSAIFVGNDTLAIGAMATLFERGLRVPEDVAVVGYDDIPTAAYTAPPLTTVKTNANTQGRVAGEMLIALLRNEAPLQRQVVIETELIIRRSCGARLLEHR